MLLDADARRLGISRTAWHGVCSVSVRPELGRTKLRRSMKPISQFGTSMQLTVLVADLRQAVRSLEISIDYEEDRARIFHAPYPIMARHLSARRDNLLLTVSTLETHLNDPITREKRRNGNTNHHQVSAFSWGRPCLGDRRPRRLPGHRGRFLLMLRFTWRILPGQANSPARPTGPRTRVCPDGCRILKLARSAAP